MRLVDPFAFITTQCRISFSQQHQLLSTPFFNRHHHAAPAAPVTPIAPAAFDCGNDDTWPVSSDDDNADGVPLPVDNNEEITFCSLPSTPDTQHDVLPSLDEFLVNTIKLNDVVSPNSAKAPRSLDLNDVVSGNSNQLQGLCVQNKEKSDLNNAVCGSSDQLGFVGERKTIYCDVNDVVCGESDLLGFSVETKRAREGDSVTPPTRANKKVRFCDEVDKIAVENTEEMVNDVVGKDSDELGFCTEERGTKENALKQPMGNNKEVKNDVVSEKFVVLGERNVTNGEFTMPSPSTTEELRSPELDGAEMEVEIENTAQIDGDTEEITVIDDCKGEEHDTEEIDISDNESGDDNEDGDTEEVAYEDELINSTLDRDSETETCENHRKCLMDIMKTLAERSRKKEKEDSEVDFLETAKRRGYTFPKPRWMSS